MKSFHHSKYLQVIQKINLNARIHESNWWSIEARQYLAHAFVSKRTGQAQVYVQRNGQNAQQISSFDSCKMITDIKLSPDDTKLIVSEANRIHLFDLTSTKSDPTLRTIEFNNRVNFASWLTKYVLAISLFGESKSEITLYSLQGKSLKTLDKNGKGY